MASGIYFYRMLADDYVDMKKPLAVEIDIVLIMANTCWAFFLTLIVC